MLRCMSKWAAMRWHWAGISQRGPKRRLAVASTKRLLMSSRGSFPRRPRWAATSMIFRLSSNSEMSSTTTKVCEILLTTLTSFLTSFFSVGFSFFTLLTTSVVFLSQNARPWPAAGVASSSSSSESLEDESEPQPSLSSLSLPLVFLVATFFFFTASSSESESSESLEDDDEEEDADLASSSLSESSSSLSEESLEDASFSSSDTTGFSR
mmetsp:Transcript_15425/g.31707  ORF Transcript_15425/g.31707 Transcript_15425/m.31707 type:complete len:210 (-) Transcript_15425:540-1169(-)